MKKSIFVIGKGYTKMKKKYYVLAATIAAMCALSACGKGNSKNTKTTEQATTAQATTEASSTTEAQTTEQATEAPADTTASLSDASVEAVQHSDEYDPVLMEVYNMIQGGINPDNPGGYNYIDAESGIVEVVANADKNEITKSLGYVVQDISGDGVPELLIGKDNEEGKSEIIEAYTFSDGAPVKIFTGSERSSYTWIGDGHFHYNGSGGATDVATGECHLSADGKELVWDDYYYTSESDSGEVQVLHNTLGEQDSENSENANMTEEEFGKIKNEYNSSKLSWSSIGNVAK